MNTMLRAFVMLTLVGGSMLVRSKFKARAP